MGRRRQSIRENFEEYFRYRIPGRVPPGGGGRIPTPPASSDAASEAARARIGASVGGSSASAEISTGGFVHDQPQLRLIVRDARGNFWSLNVSPNSAEVSGSGVMPFDIPIDPKLLSMLLGEDGAATAAHPRGDLAGAQVAQGNAPGQNAAASQAQSSPLWVRIPPGQPGQELLQTIARFVSPTGNLSQDGLHALLNSPQFQALFQGAQLTQGASQMLSLNMLVGVLIPPSLLAANPEMAKALLVAQGLPPGLIHSIPDRAIAGALQALLQTGASASGNPLHFLQSVASALTLAGTPVQEVQNLLMQLLETAKNQGIGLPGGKDVSPEMLKALAAKMMASNNPQLLGLNQMVQENFGQGLAQIFNAFIRVFMGGAMMQSQQMWPQAVPNEKMLAELGGLFGALGAKGNQAKEDKKRSRKRGRKELRIDDPAFQRVERKDDVEDEAPEEEGEELEPEMEEELALAEASDGAANEAGSIFIKVDES